MKLFKDDIEEEKEIEDTNEQGEYIKIAISKSETMMAACIKEYDKLHKEYGSILTWTVKDFTAHCENKNITAKDWREFLLDSRVRRWIDDENYLEMNATKMKLLKNVGTNNSTATVQALTALTKATEDTDSRIDDNKIYIFSFMPLNDQEERLNNVQMLKSIPDEIRDAIQYIPNGTSNYKKQ